jgi:hypothetical protein
LYPFFFRLRNCIAEKKKLAMALLVFWGKFTQLIYVGLDSRFVRFSTFLVHSSEWPSLWAICAPFCVMSICVLAHATYLPRRGLLETGCHQNDAMEPVADQHAPSAALEPACAPPPNSSFLVNYCLGNALTSCADDGAGEADGSEEIYHEGSEADFAAADEAGQEVAQESTANSPQPHEDKAQSSDEDFVLSEDGSGDQAQQNNGDNEDAAGSDDEDDDEIYAESSESEPVSLSRRDFFQVYALVFPSDATAGCTRGADARRSAASAR